ncbi:CLK4-associating serine/arginine rich protein [Monodelphis domestica]|uniref:CLK4 associating serine/arginine rich protein n=1 Tax=Monodelphis domestica TaxID=13616 RepID=F6R0P4_MONDO|nr:CLK4-associating serine/arginine rich protein [Monodelphis domestica]XP_056652340.1 CLK4-associating serine/arginine rich protein [Monodelphis domestica]
MWHEARKHERKLRGMMVDYKKRAERRREYYEKIKKDPAQFLQVHGRACKVHLDSAVALAAESPVNMMPWQGDTNTMIDRFDVRAHLDYIPEYTPPLLTTISPEQESDERKCNYERYRGLVQNDFAGISEEQCLYQIYIDELYGGLQKPNEEEKKKLAEKKASIGYTYEDSTVAEVEKALEKPEDEESPGEEESNSDEDEVIPDIDVEVDVDELNQEQVADLNKQATTYGMADGDFVRMLRKDKEEAEAIKHAKALEEEKAMYSGRRSRRQRREFREKRLKGRKISPPSYARRDSPTYDPYKRSPSESSSESRSRSRSPTPGREEKITFITSFGGSDEEAAAAAAAAGAGAAPGKPRAGQPPTAPQPGSGPAPGRNAGSRRRSSSSSSSTSSTPTSSSRSSSRSRRGGHYRPGRHMRSRSRSRSRRYSRSRSRGRRHSGGGSRDGRRYSRSPTRRGYGARRRSRSRSRSGERYRRGGRAPRHRSSSRSSWSPSLSRSRSRSHSRSRTHSPSPLREKLTRPAASPAVGEKLKKADTASGKETGAAKPKLTPQEKLKLRMQKALNRQFKADKKAAQEKMIQQEHERQEREDELRAMARKIRMKERERREKEREEWERQYSRQSRSPSPRYSREYSSSRRRSRSRSRSPHYRH